MNSIGDILNKKGRHVWSVAPNDTVHDSVKMMSEKGVGGLVVVEGDRLVGILTERDYARKVILEDRSSKSTRVADIMTGKVLWVTEAQTVDECMALMIEKNLRHLPVMDGETLVGVVSIRDLVQAAIHEQQVMIDHLQTYITRQY
jgi:CBS domain-containing protein